MIGNLFVRLVTAGLLCAGVTATASAQTTSTFVPPDVDPPFAPVGDWSDTDRWDTPNYPDNGQPNAGDTYNAIIRSGQARLDGDYTINNLTIGRTLDDSDQGTLSHVVGVMRTLDVNGLFTFEGGRIFANTTVNANGGLLFTGDATKSINNTTGASTYTAYINNAATGNWDNGHVSGTLLLSTTNPQARSQVNNLATGTFNATAGGFNFAPLFNNYGVMNIDPGDGLHINFSAFYNDGVVNLLSGSANVTLYPGVLPDLTPGGGTFNLSAGTTLHVGSFRGASHYAGAGNLVIAGDPGSANNGPGTGSINLTGTITIEGTVALPNGGTTGQLVLHGAQASPVVNGGFTTGSLLAGSITATGMTTWQEGGYSGTGTIHANGGVTFASTNHRHVLSGSTTLNLGGDSVVNSDTALIYVENDATMNILEGATLTFLDSGGIRASKDPGTLHNAGTIHVTGGSVSIGAHTVNTGLIIADGFGSNVNFNGHDSNVPTEQQLGLDQQGGELRMLGARIGYIASFTGGKLTGYHTNSNVRVTALTITAGTISPGLTTGPDDPVGTMYFDNLILESGAIVEFDLAGTEDTEFDRLLVPVTTPVEHPYGDLQLGGTLVLRFAEGFESLVSETDTFTIIEALEASTGAFANVAAGERLTTADGLGSFIVNYGPSSAYGDKAVVLSDYQVAIPEPASLALLASLLGLTLRRRGQSNVE